MIRCTKYIINYNAGDIMKTVNGEGHGYSGEEGPDDLMRVVDDLIKRADHVLRIMAATPAIGCIVIPKEFPFPLDSINLN